MPNHCRAEQSEVSLCRLELIKYPPQFKIGFLSNNPPVYDLLPQMRQARKKYMESHGLGRLIP